MEEGEGFPERRASSDSADVKHRVGAPFEVDSGSSLDYGMEGTGRPACRMSVGSIYSIIPFRARRASRRSAGVGESRQ